MIPRKRQDLGAVGVFAKVNVQHSLGIKAQLLQNYLTMVLTLRNNCSINILYELKNSENYQMASLNTPYGTLSFPTLFKPRPRAAGQEEVFSAVLIFNPAQQNTPAYKALVEACKKVAKDEWGDKLNLKEVKMPFRDAGEKAGSWGGFVEGDVFISPWTKSKP